MSGYVQYLSPVRGGRANTILEGTFIQNLIWVLSVK